MNLIEAIKSGKPFKRQNTAGYVNPDCSVLTIHKDDLIAIDWEIQETISDKFEDRILELEKLIQEMGDALGRAFQSAKKQGYTNESD